MTWLRLVLVSALLAFCGGWVGAQRELSANYLMAGLAPGIGARAAAMGDAHIAVATDATAFYWNPAGLAAGGDTQWHALSARFDGHHVDLGQVRDMLDIARAHEGMGMAHWNLLREVVDGRVEAGGAAFSAYRNASWAVGAFSQGWATMDVVGLEPHRVFVLGYGMDATNVGVAHGGSLSEELDWGLQVGWLKAGQARTKGIVWRHRDEVRTTVAHRSNHTTNWSVSGGVRYQASENVHWGLVLRNVNAPRLEFTLGNIFGYDPSVHLGFAAYNPEEQVLFALDVHNVFQANDMEPKLCVGLEKRVGARTLLRFGGTRSRLTCGVGLEAGNWQIDLASGSNPESQLALSGVVGF